MGLFLMPTFQPVPFWSQSAETRSPVVSKERLVNWYLVQNEQNAKYPFALYPTPGLTLFNSDMGGPCRGIYHMGPYLYVVSGNSIFLLDSNGSSTELGEIDGTGMCQMADNGTHVLVVARRYAYAVNQDECLQIAEAGLVGAASQDGYGVAVKNGTDQFYWSDVDDMTTWGGSSFSSADAKGDLAVGVASLARNMWVFGKRTIEIMYNAALSSQPFVRGQGGFLEVGCLSPGSIAVGNNTLFWLGHDYQVYMARGFEPTVVSPPWVTRVIEGLSGTESAEAFVYLQRGHTFYVLTFSNKTIVFDMNTGKWHYRKSHGLDRWRVQGHAFAWGKHIVGDCVNGNIYELDLDTYSENGTTISREADSAPIHAGGQRMVMDELFVDMDYGVGLDGSAQGSDPELMMRTSDNGGRTWSNERIGTIGKLGEYDVQARFHNMGQFRQRLIRIVVSDPVFACVVGAYMRARGQSS
jgi:hypothetical protein